MATYRINESELRDLIEESVRSALLEMDKSTAIYPMTVFAATNNLTDNGVFHSKNKSGKIVRTNRINIKSRNIADKAIMHYVIQEMEPTLSFRMPDSTPNKKVGIEFEIKEIKEYNDEYMIFYGEMISANWKGYVSKHCMVKCIFGSNGKDGNPSDFKFYLLQNIGGAVKTPLIEMLNDPENGKIVKEIISNIYNLRQEAIQNAASFKDLSCLNVNDKLVIKGKRRV